MHPEIMYQFAKDRQRELIEEAERRRMVIDARAGQPGLSARVLGKLGGLLITIGKQLQRRNAPQRPATLRWAQE